MVDRKERWTTDLGFSYESFNPYRQNVISLFVSVSLIQQMLFLSHNSRFI
jgi:hypothetical protein